MGHREIVSRRQAVPDADLIAAARLAAEGLFETFADLDRPGSIEYWIDSAGGITWHDRRLDPRVNAATAAIASAAAGIGPKAAGAPSNPVPDRLAPRPWSPRDRMSEIGI